MQDSALPLPPGIARSAILGTAALAHWRHNFQRRALPAAISNTFHDAGDNRA
jgi:hypothetical protein